MTKEFVDYHQCELFLRKEKAKIDKKSRNKLLKESWSSFEKQLWDIENLLSFIEENANVYIYTTSYSEYKSVLTGYFGNEVVIDEATVKLTAAYRDLFDCETNTKDIVIMISEG